MFRKILVPVDGSATASRGLKQAIALAKNQKAMLVLLHVVDEAVVTQSMVAGGYYIDGLIESLVSGGKKLLAKADAEVRAARLRCRSVLVEDIAEPVADVIVRQAKKQHADLIVIGTHGRRGLTRLVLGSDAEGVVRNSPVPVLLVRASVRSSARRAKRK